MLFIEFLTNIFRKNNSYNRKFQNNKKKKLYRIFTFKIYYKRRMLRLDLHQFENWKQQKYNEIVHHIFIDSVRIGRCIGRYNSKWYRRLWHLRYLRHTRIQTQTLTTNFVVSYLFNCIIYIINKTECYWIKFVKFAHNKPFLKIKLFWF